MKKILLTAAVVLLGSAAWAVPYFDGVYDQYQVIYSPSGKFFSTGGMVEDRIVLTKKTSTGSGNYSEYYYSDGKLAFALGSDFEIVLGPRLIAVHNADLTFYEVVYKGGKFTEKKLSFKEVQKLFPDAKVLRISSFIDEARVVKRSDDGKAEIVLYNDSTRSFYKYSYKPADVKKTDINALIEAAKPEVVEFSHYGEDTQNNPKYHIIVR